MSDGPHRSLPMRKGWRALAERGDGKLHTAEQVRDAIPLALIDDWKEERCDAFLQEAKAILADPKQPLLFKLSKDEIANALKSIQGSGYPFRRIISDSLVHAVEDGHSGEEALVKGVADALTIRCGAGARQVEEHYLRSSSDHRAANVRRRIEDGASKTDFPAMARQFCRLDKPFKPRRYDGLDDGVSVL